MQEAKLECIPQSSLFILFIYNSTFQPFCWSDGSKNPCAIIWLSYTFIRCSNLEILEPVDTGHWKPC